MNLNEQNASSETTLANLAPPAAPGAISPAPPQGGVPPQGGQAPEAAQGNKDGAPPAPTPGQPGAQAPAGGEVTPDRKSKPGELPRGVVDRFQRNARIKREQATVIAEQGQYINQLKDYVSKLIPPSAEQFQGNEPAYQAALAEYHAAVQDARSAQRQAQGEVQRATSQIQTADNDTWEAKVDAAYETFPDWDQVVSQSTVPMSPELHRAVKDSPLGAMAVYYLAKNPREGFRISKLSYPEVLTEFARLESRFAPAPAPAPQPASAPPAPPIEPVGGGATTTKSSAYKEWEAKRNASHGVY